MATGIRNKLALVFSRYTFSCDIFSCIVSTNPSVPVVTSGGIFGHMPIVRCAAITCPIEVTKCRALGLCSNLHVVLHVTKLRAATIESYITIIDFNIDMSQYRFLVIDTTTIEIGNISMINQPCDITF